MNDSDFGMIEEQIGFLGDPSQYTKDELQEVISDMKFAISRLEEHLTKYAAVACPKCGQVANGQGGEYPCSACGVPTLHDDVRR